MIWNFQMALAPGPLPPACMLQLAKNTFLSSRCIEELIWMQSCRVSTFFGTCDLWYYFVGPPFGWESGDVPRQIRWELA